MSWPRFIPVFQMPREIKWTPEALQDYHRQLDYLAENWGAASAVKFIDNAGAALRLLAIQPEIGQRLADRPIRFKVINKYIVLYYTFDDNVLVLLRFFHGSQHPDRLGL